MDPLLATPLTRRSKPLMLRSAVMLGEGIYTISEAARLSGIAPSRLRRWLEGYDFRARSGAIRHSKPAFHAGVRGSGRDATISFLDLLEAMFFDRFHRQGVTWNTLRRAAAQAAVDFQDPHPFSTRRFRTDGRSVFAEVAKDDGDLKLLDIVKRQRVFTEVIEPLLTQIDYDVSGFAASWSPMGKRIPVIVDPSRAFGRPIIKGRGVRTSVLAAAVLKGNASVKEVASWYEVEVEEVAAAVEFEERLAANTLAAA
jgi:uncharacterized protein (DUF433 family)